MLSLLWDEFELFLLLYHRICSKDQQQHTTIFVFHSALILHSVYNGVFIFSTLTQVGAYPVDPFMFSTIIFLAWWISARCNSIPSWSTLSRIPLSIHCGRVTSSAPSISTCAFLLHHACWQKDLEVEDFAEVLAIGSQKIAQGVHLKPLPHTDTHLRS